MKVWDQQLPAEQLLRMQHILSKLLEFSKLPTGCRYDLRRPWVHWKPLAAIYMSWSDTRLHSQEQMTASAWRIAGAQYHLQIGSLSHPPVPHLSGACCACCWEAIVSQAFSLASNLDQSPAN